VNVAAKQLTLACKAASNGQPEASDLAAIAAYTIREFKAEELYVRTVALAHNGIDRDNEVFDERFLDTLATTLKGKGLFEIHPQSWEGDSGMPEGLWFEAFTESMSFEEARKVLREPGLQFPPDRKDARILFGKFYLPAHAANEGLRVKVDAGLGFASIGFRAQKREPIRDAAGRELQAQRITGDGEALEASLVWLGAQPGARVIKSVQNRGDNVDLKALIIALSAICGLSADATPEQVTESVKSLKASQGGAPDPRVGKFDSLKSALGAEAAVLDDPAKLVTLIADGKTFRDTTIDEIVAADRASGRIKADTDADLQVFKSAYAALPAVALKALHATATAGTVKGSQLAPSDPNAPTKGTVKEGQGAAPALFQAPGFATA